MPQFLSDDWIAAMDDALRTNEAFARASADTDFRLGTTVTGTEHGTVTFVLMLDRGVNRIRRTPRAHASTSHQRADAGSGDNGRRADVTFTSDHGTAVAIASGGESAQAAFMAGRLRVSGDSRLLMVNQTVLRDLGDVFAAVRAQTDFTATSTTTTAATPTG